MPQLKLEKLLELLGANTTKVKVLTPDRTGHYLVPADKALAMAKTGRYLGVGSNRKLRYLREIAADDRHFRADASFWDGRGVIRFHEDQRSPGRGRPFSE